TSRIRTRKTPQPLWSDLKSRKPLRQRLKPCGVRISRHFKRRSVKIYPRTLNIWLPAYSARCGLTTDKYRPLAKSPEDDTHRYKQAESLMNHLEPPECILHVKMVI
ncbi:uncharacterized protein METZ01_LOCUS375105, partial [marine metagenome]